MATDEQWQLVEEPRGRVEALEANMNGIAWAFQHSAAKLQQDEDVERVAAPRLMDADLLRHFQDARGDSLDRLRAVYQLGRKHGATQATCPHIRKSDDGTGYCSLAEKTADSQPTPNDGQIRSSAPAGGLLEKISWLIAKRWSESRPGTDCTPFGKEVICKVADAVAETGMLGSNEIAKWLRMRAWGTEDIPQPAPAVGLVEVLGSVPDVWNAGKPLHPAARRAAIHHIADWLEQQQEVPISAKASADYFAAMLREEADR